MLRLLGEQISRSPVFHRQAALHAIKHCIPRFRPGLIDDTHSQVLSSVLFGVLCNFSSTDVEIRSMADDAFAVALAHPDKIVEHAAPHVMTTLMNMLESSEPGQVPAVYAAIQNFAVRQGFCSVPPSSRHKFARLAWTRFFEARLVSEELFAIATVSDE